MALELPKPGEMLGKYTVVRALGEGGMGCVFEAVHEKLHQRVAIKVLRPARSIERDDVARFEREARLAARLKTSHAVRIFDVDVTPTGLPYIVMELVDGRDLADELRARGDGIPVSEIIGWAIEICEALTEAHALGIVHRDIKSSNILLVREGKKTIAKLVDFGIAKDFKRNENGKDAQTLTADGAWVGTPAYMAPEQFGVGGPVDARADVWALGVMLYRSFAGRFPFEGGDGASMIEAITKRAPTFLSEVRPSIPSALSDVVMKAIRKDPAQRYSSADEFAEALAPFARFDAAAAPRVDPLAKTESGDITETVLYPATTKDKGAKSEGTTRAMFARWALGTIAIGALAILGWRFAHDAKSTNTNNNTTVSLPPPVLSVLNDDAQAPVPIESASVSITLDASAAADAKPHAPLGRTEPNCVCEVVGPRSGGGSWLTAACTSPMTPRCMCKEEGSKELCPTPWTVIADRPNMVECANEWGFGGAGKQSGDTCSGLAWTWVGDDPKPVRHDGKLSCEDCYGPPVPQAAVPHAPCRAYLGKGHWRDGTWACQAPKPK